VKWIRNCPFEYLRARMVIYLKVKPNQRFDKVEKTADGWQIRIRAPATDGKANKHLVEYLSEILQVSKSGIVLKKGKTSALKCLEIQMDEEEFHRKLESSINKTM
jgi:uncharacterized protein